MITLILSSFTRTFLMESSNVRSTELCPQHGQKKALPITENRAPHLSHRIFSSIASLAVAGIIVLLFRTPFTSSDI